MKRVVNILICLLLCITLISGCKNASDKTSNINTTDIRPSDIEGVDNSKIGDTGGLKLPIANYDTDISMLVGTNEVNLTDTFFFKELSRRTGLNIDVMAIPASTINEKAKVLIASKTNMPNILSACLSELEVNDLGPQGAFAPINKYIDDLPNFKRLIADDEDKSKRYLIGFAAADGNLYSFPSYETKRAVNHGMLYRKDIFDKHNIPVWTNQEEFYQVLKKLKELYPDSTPYTSKSDKQIFTQWGQSWGLNVPGLYFDEATEIWKYSSTDEKYKDMLDFMKKLYDEGLIDQEFLTLTAAQWTNKMTQKDKAFVTFDWIGRLDMFKAQTAETVPEYDLRYAYPVGPTGKVITIPEVSDQHTVVANNANSLSALKLLDYLISPSGAELMTMGVEGVTYELDENGMAKYIEFEEGQTLGIQDLEHKYGMFNGLYRRFDKRSVYFNYTEREKEAQDLMINKEGGGFLPEDPVLQYNSEEKDEQVEKLMELNKAAEEFSIKYIISDETGDKAWAAWINKAEGMGVRAIENTANNVYKRMYK